MKFTYFYFGAKDTLPSAHYPPKLGFVQTLTRGRREKKMADFSDQIEEIKTLLSSAATTKSQKPVAYSTLLHLQEQSSSATGDPSLIQSLADASLALLPPILADIFDDDEEIAAQALKCLGFMIYHPTLVATFSRDDANLIVNSLTKVIITTKIKSVCNLGVWCLSVQQFPSLYLAANFHSLLRAIVHALDNPIGSLSTTFEATQAVTKLASQLYEKMRDTSNIWAPPVYRRSVSIDKRVRDISERCLLKIRSTICPPSLALSKAIVIDLKGRLLPGMKELLNHGLKIQAIQAWGWFIRLLGPYAVKNRHLVNEMLKIPEQTFADADPQVQIASLVAWEGLIDALIQHGRTCNGNDSGTEGQTLSKSIKLVMAPIIGIMSSRCDVSVYSSCLNTWCYLLHTLDSSVNSPSTIKTAWEPVFDAVFRVTPDSKSIWVWITCLDLLDDFILTKGGELEGELNNQVNYHLSDKIPTTGPPISSERPWKHYPIKWMPWDLNKLDFCFKIIQNLINGGPKVNITEVKCLVHDSALRIFRSVMKGVRCVFNNSSINYDEILLCLNKTFELLKLICESMISENTDSNHLRLTTLQFVGAVIEEIEPSILGSPLYKVALDLKYFDHLNSANMTKHGEVTGVQFKVYMDMVSPIVYLLNLYFCGVFKSTFNAPGAEFIMQDACRYVKIVLSSYEPSEIVHAIMGLLYKHVGFDYLKVWVAISKGLIEYVDEVKDISLLTLGSDMSHCLALCQLLSYPFAVCSVHQEQLTIKQCTGIQESADVSIQSHRQLELELVFDVWKSLYACVNRANRSENSTSNALADELALALNGCFDEDMKVLECGTKLNPSNNHQNKDLLFLYGNVVICVLEDSQMSAIRSTGSIDTDDGDYKQSSGVDNLLRLTARFLTLAETNPPPAIPPLIPRVFSTLVHFVGQLHMKDDILSFIQKISTPLLQWMTTPEEPYEDTNRQLQLLWTEILNRLQKSRPPLTFDSSFLKLQAPLLEQTLDHPNPSLSNPTITFWNSTYATEKLDYPQSLIPVLDKLSRHGKINLFKRRIPCHSRIDAPPRYRASTATKHRSSKRVELVEDIGKKGCLGLKRKKSELTEHQKEVRRAQQGRERDCNGHGPGIRTYTGVDFSQGNEESQDSEDIRDAESILELLRRAS
ncbi:hypothetical protein RHMOL_Rhmol01G0055200 [Rhododendron molle]|uniref:Uncharacterized protein n=1 Tax=Rhododendron molle TaxID=49168 RepID=A0ACC0Q129_RHOML|nr:hypothetical protein RHMOL_Rhmol01G0055200 [Rhododendron molle]